MYDELDHLKSAQAAREKADWISHQPHLALVGATDATFAN